MATLHDKFLNASGYADQASAANAMRQAIWCMIENMAEAIIDQQAGETRPKKAAALGAQVAVLHALQARVGNIEIKP